jgi:hypothetical protein
MMQKFNYTKFTNEEITNYYRNIGNEAMGEPIEQHELGSLELVARLDEGLEVYAEGQSLLIVGDWNGLYCVTIPLDVGA